MSFTFTKLYIDARSLFGDRRSVRFFRLNWFLAPALIDRLLHRGAYVDSKTVPTTTRFTADLNPQKETQLHYTGAVL